MATTPDTKAAEAVASENASLQHINADYTERYGFLSLIHI